MAPREDLERVEKHFGKPATMVRICGWCNYTPFRGYWQPHYLRACAQNIINPNRGVFIPAKSVTDKVAFPRQWMRKTLEYDQEFYYVLIKFMPPFARPIKNSISARDWDWLGHLWPMCESLSAAFRNSSELRQRAELFVTAAFGKAIRGSEVIMWGGIHVKSTH